MRRRSQDGGGCIRRRRSAAAATAACLFPRWLFAWWRKSKAAEEIAPAAASQSVELGGQKEPLFNLGVGLGLMYAIAGCKNEINKIVDLRMEFEALIQSCKAEEHASERRQLSTAPPSAVSTLTNVESCENFKDVVVGDCSSETMITTCGNQLGNCSKMNELEAELEAELGRLQLDFDSQVKEKEETENNAMFGVAADDDYDVADDDDVNDDTALYEEDHDNGVCPYKLERRLHELLETRQQERIEELESALESAIRKIHHKDEELWWWKDTAKLISRHVPNEATCFLRRCATTK